jgi:hypothetical protein
MSTQYTLPIVGAHFRPPAKQLLSVLGMGHALWFTREPENPHDGNAIAVYLDLSTLTEPQRDALEPMLTTAGFDWQSLVDDDNTQTRGETRSRHLGYIPAVEALWLAPKIDESEEFEIHISGTFGISLANKPTITFTIT